MSQEAILEALEIQEERRREGRKVPLLGQILVELNHMTPEQLQQLIEVMYPVEDGNDQDLHTPSTTNEEN